jgi:hypothetical protein
VRVTGSSDQDKTNAKQEQQEVQEKKLHERETATQLSVSLFL